MLACGLRRPSTGLLHRWLSQGCRLERDLILPAGPDWRSPTPSGSASAGPPADWPTLHPLAIRLRTEPGLARARHGRARARSGLPAAPRRLADALALPTVFPAALLGGGPLPTRKGPVDVRNLG